MQLTTLENTSITDITAAFNAGFSDYVIKIEATEAYLNSRFRGARVDFACSAGGWVDGELVALLITGIDDWQGEKTAFNAATGVAPSARGNHFTSQAYEFLTPKLKQKGVTQLMLEVVQSNDRAVRVYERVGFEKKRGLCCFAGEPSIPDSIMGEGFRVELNGDLDLSTAESFHDFLPSWENSFAALRANRSPYDLFRVHRDGQLVGYAVVDSASGRIMSFGVHPEFRRHGIATRLFSEIAARHQVLKINNVEDADQATLAFLDHFGLKNVIDQFEMAMSL